MVESSPAAQPPLRIGTRRSNLAVVQAEGIRDSLQKVAPGRSFEIEALHTLGDKDQSTALYSFGAKSLWTTELEDKLTSGQLDVIVHCLKGEPNPLLFALFVLVSDPITSDQICRPGFPTPANWQPFLSAMILVMPL